MKQPNPRKFRIPIAALLAVLLVSSGFVMGYKVAQEIKIEKADVQSAQKIIDLQLTDAEIEQLLPNLNRGLADVRELHEYPLDNATPPAVLFNPNIGKMNFPAQKKIEWLLPNKVEMPKDKNDLAFYTVAQLSSLIKNKKISSVELTEFFLDRLEKHGGTLEAIITITKERALAQAKKADDLLAKGTYLGPLHGIPYGAKDLLAVPGYKTTWGAGPYKDQDRGDELATVIKKLDDAGAVLVAKLTLGALAMGDVWYGGTTKNPWNLEQGASGSSAGSASATSAGLVPFALGTETLGSIVSPSTRNGVTGLRPTFGRVSKAGAMALSWSMDKIGPIARNAFDCALVFEVIRGSDGIDLSVQDAPFNYNGKVDLSKLRVGYLKSYFDNTRNETQKKNDQQVLDELTKLGADLKPVEWVSDLPFGGMLNILSAEAAAAFDELTRSNRDSLLVRQNSGAWPNSFREARFITAVDYINANRVRYEVMQKVNELMKDYDVIISPSTGNNQLSTTNLTGHPAVVMKNGYTQNGSPTSISFIGNLYDEATILAVARAYQEATGFDEENPPLFVKK